MKLFTKIVLAISILIIGGIIVVPNIYNSKINEYIVKSEKDFKDKGIEVEIKNTNDTYFNVKREYTATIADSSFILKDLFKNIGSRLSTREMNTFKKSLDNTKFLFSINLPKYPAYQKNAINVSLKSLSTNIEKKLSKEKAGKDLLSFIHNKGLQVNISLDNFKLKEARLKDINLNVKDNNNANLITNTKNFVVTFDDIKKFQINVDEINTAIKNNSNNLNYSLNINSYSYKYNEKNTLNASEDISIKNITLNLNNLNEKNQISIDNIESNSLMATKNDIFNFFNNMKIKKMNVDFLSLNIEIDNIITKISINNIKEKLIQNIIDSVNKGDEEKIIENLQVLINEGFLFNIDKLTFDSTKFSSAKDNFDFGKFSLHSTLNIKSNTLNLVNARTPQVLNYINSNLNIELLEKDVIQIMTKLKLPADFLQYVRIEKDNAFIDAEFKTNHIYINKKMVL